MTVFSVRNGLQQRNVTPQYKCMTSLSLSLTHTYIYIYIYLSSLSGEIIAPYCVHVIREEKKTPYDIP